MLAEIRDIRTPFHEFQAGFNVILELIKPGTRVLDLGCGTGSLLQQLRNVKDAEVCGVELDQEKVVRCIERGIRVMRLDLDQGLEGFPDLSYEYAVMSRTLQQLMRPDIVVKEMLRVASKSIIAFPISATGGLRSGTLSKVVCQSPKHIRIRGISHLIYTNSPLMISDAS